MVSWKTLCLMCTATLVTACGPTAPPRPTVKPYAPSFSYASQKSAQKLDIAIGVVGAEFAGMGKIYWSQNRTDDVARRMVSGLRSGFNELLINKGFGVAGPYDSLENMTFPEKKGSNFVLYAELDIAATAKASNQNTDVSTNYLTGSQTTTQTCDVTFALQGDISLVVKEPLSGEKMWIKRLEVAQQSPPVEVEGHACLGVGVPKGVAAKNAWARMHEGTFKQVMKALDKYVNGEEFLVLQRQAKELRAKKAY